jgi:DNA-binding transcriptional LysR family regulator
MDKLLAMTAFLAVVDEGGFAAASRRLKVSPPVVTRAVSDLEKSIGVRLLTRTTRVVRLTDVGARYAEDCRRILADVLETDEAAAGTHGSVRGRLVVTAPALFGRMHVTPIVTAYLRRYPETEVDCRFLDRVVNMMDEGVDVAIRIENLPDSSHHATRVGQVRRVVCASPAYLKKRMMARRRRCAYSPGWRSPPMMPPLKPRWMALALRASCPIRSRRIWLPAHWWKCCATMTAA